MLLFIVTYSYPLHMTCNDNNCCTIIIITCHVISPQLTVQCHTQKKKAPCIMYRGSAIADLNVVYCSPGDSNSVYRYQLREDQWNDLPSCSHRDSGLVVIDGVLTAVGGWDGSYTNKLFTLRQSRWVEKYPRWVEKYPPMNTARSKPAVVSTSDGQHMNVIAIGGYGDGVGGWIDAVELYNTGSSTWSQITSLPQPLTFPSATICDNQLYVIGGDGNGYSCSLQALLSSDQPISSQSMTRSLTWTPLPRLPVTWSTAATLCGQLVIIGGKRDGSPVNSIHQLVDGQWVNIGSMSSVRRLCLVASPSPDKMVVVGGFGAFIRNTCISSQVDSVEVCVAV